MGWTFCSAWTNATETKEGILRECFGPDHEVLASRSTSYGRHFWVAMKIKPTGKSFVCLFLLAGGKEEWGYKSIDEGMGPYETDCPLDLLSMTDEPTEGYAVEWRKKVRAAAALRKTAYTNGDKVLIYGKPYTVIGKEKRSYRVSREEDGRVFRCGPSKMVSAPMG